MLSCFHRSAPAFTLLATCLILTVGGVTAVAADTTDAVPIPRMRLLVPVDASAPTIDGYVSEDEWYDAMRFVGLSDTSDGKIADTPFTGYIKSDGQKLYVAFRRKVFSSEHLVQNSTQRDSAVYEDDSCEIYIYPQPEHDGFYQIIFNALGTIFDRAGDAVSWNADVRVAHNFGDREQGGMTTWDAEFAVPLADVGITGDLLGRQIGLGIFLNQMSPNTRSLALTTQTGLFLQPDKAAIVTFVKSSKVLSIHTLGRPLVGEVLPELKLDKDADNARVTLAPDAGEPVEQTVSDRVALVRFPPVLQKAGTATLTIIAPPDAEPNAADFYFSKSFDYDSSPLSVQSTNYPSLEEVVLEVNFESFAQRERVCRYTVTIGEVSTIIERRSSSPSEKLVVSTHGIDPGEHEIVVALLDADDGELLIQTLAYSKEGAEVWLNKKVGIDPGHVPPPFTPMKIRDRTVEVIGREILLAQTGLPARITSQGLDLLAGPVSLRGVIEGQPADLTAATPFAFTTTAPDDSIGEAEVSLGALHGTLKQTVSFDGFCWYEITLDAGQGVDAQNVVLEIEMPEEIAVSHQVAGIDFQKYGIEWEATSDVLTRDWDLPFTPHLWLGNTTVGLAWIAEDHRGWQVADDAKAMQIVRAGGKVILRANIVDKPIKLIGRMTWAFGLQASPIKPISDRMQRIMTINFVDGLIYPYLSQIPNTETFALYQGHRPYRDTFLAYMGLPEPEWPERCLAAVARQKAIDVKAVPYSTITTLSIGLDDFKTYRGDWDGGSVWTGTANAHADPSPFTECNTQSKTYQDFIVWRFMQSSQAYGGDATYYDLYCPPTVVSGSGNVFNFSETQKYVTRNGETVLPTLTLSTREIARRLYIAYKKENPDRVIYANGGGGFYLPLMSFVDAVIGQSNVYVHRYPTMLTYDRFRSGFLGYPLGVKTFFMPHHAANLYDLKPMGRYLNGVTLNHNDPMFLNFVDQAQIMPYWRVYYEGDWGTQTFLPYWEHPHLTDLDPEKFKVSGWYNPDTGRGLLCVASLSDQPVATPIELGEGWTFNSAASVTDATREVLDGNSYIYPARLGTIAFEGDYDEVKRQGKIGATFAGGVGEFEPYGVLLLNVADR